MNYLILGSSAAGVNAARELRKLDKESNITIASKDEFLYSRCILHHYIEGKRDETMLHFAGPNVIEEHDINFLKGYEASILDDENKQVQFTNGETLSYDKLLIATGASSFIPPVPGLREGNQVIGLRNFDDAVYIKDNIKDGMSIAIIGSGLVGMDAMEALTHHNVNVHVIDFASHVLNLQLDQNSASLYQQEAEKRGVTCHFNTLAKEVKLDDDSNVIGLELDNGESFDVDLVISAAGTRSNIGFLQDSNVELWERGLKFNNFGETNIADVYGAGDVSGVHPIWPMAVKEGAIAANNMAGNKIEMTDFFASRATMNFFGIPTMSVGNPNGKDIEEIEFHIYDQDGIYRKVATKDGKIIGAILQNDIDYSGILIQLIKNEININDLKKGIFDLDYSDFFHLEDNVEFKY